MIGAETLPQYWRAIRPRPARPPINWLRGCMILAVGCAGCALVWAGVTLVGVGEQKLGAAVAGIGVVVFAAASQVGV